LTFLDKFLDWAYQCLLDNESAQEYLRGRGSSAEQWARHRIGFIGGAYEVDPIRDPAHSDVCREAKHLRCDTCRYKAWSSAWEGEEDSFKEQRVGQRIQNSIVLPLTTYAGTCIGFQVRSLVEKSYDTFTLTRRPEGYFFGTAAAMESIWATREVTLVEGPFDHLITERLITPNVLALTTSAIGASQIKFLRRFVRKVNLCQDLDKAGREGVKSFIDQYGTEFEIVRNIKYKHSTLVAKDANDLWKLLGDVSFSRHFRAALA
jgi:DNA primase